LNLAWDQEPSGGDFLFKGQYSTKIVPPKEYLTAFKSVGKQKVTVFIIAIRDQNILKSFPFLSNFELTIAILFLKLIIVFDEKVIEF
jgi:hypothetical protein